MADSARTARPALGYMLAVANAVVSGVAVYVNSFAVATFSSPVLFTALKDAVTGAILLAMVVLVPRQRARFRHLSGPDWAWLVLVSLVGGSVPYALFFIGLRQAGAVTGALGSHLEFVIVALLAWSLLRERLTPAIAAALLVLLAATLLSVDLRLLVLNLGTVLILVASLLFATEYVIVKHLFRGRLKPTTVMTAKLTLGTLVLFAYLAVTGGLGALSHLTALQAGYTLATGVILLGFTVTLYFAIRHARVTAVAAIGSAAPVVTIGLEVLLGHPVSLALSGLPLLLTVVAVATILVVGLRQDEGGRRPLEPAS
ncbi:MAG: DMT family transporter [Candidatus Dormibacteraeota bacterium]|nr:DMT family transporter [Candidatus Dormibacteraeota bacterium]